MTVAHKNSPARGTTAAVLAMAFALHAHFALAGEASPRVAAIQIDSFMFSPQTLTVTAGTVVTWTNLDEEVHSVVSDTGLFKSGGLDTNQQFSFRFEKPGTYHFTCSLHPRMVGTVIVQ